MSTETIQDDGVAHEAVLPLSPAGELVLDVDHSGRTHLAVRGVTHGLGRVDAKRPLLDLVMRELEEPAEAYPGLRLQRRGRDVLLWVRGHHAGRVSGRALAIALGWLAREVERVAADEEASKSEAAAAVPCRPLPDEGEPEQPATWWPASLRLPPDAAPRRRTGNRHI